VFQATIKAGYWFAAQPTDPEGFSFLGCTVAPGFDFEDFELATAEDLNALYPDHQTLIRQFCR
jgi:predicted cupin superfamily sugar epimerase